MKLMEFALQNAELIQKLFSDENDGEMVVSIDDFCFNSSDLEVEWEETALKFSVEVDPFKFVTTMMPEEMKENVDSIKSISDPNVRQKIVEFMETEIKETVEGEKDMAVDNLEEAKGALREAEETMNNVLDAISDVKHDWGVP